MRALSIIGIDRRGKEYASFSRELCERNARAEGVARISFRQGGAFALHDIFSRARYGDMQAFARKLSKALCCRMEDLLEKDGRY